MVDVGLSKRNQGWECPRCHATYAPWVSRCQRCYEADDTQERYTYPELMRKYFPNIPGDEWFKHEEEPARTITSPEKCLVCGSATNNGLCIKCMLERNSGGESSSTAIGKPYCGGTASTRDVVKPKGKG